MTFGFRVHGKATERLTTCGLDRASVMHLTNDPAKVTCVWCGGNNQPREEVT